MPFPEDPHPGGLPRRCRCGKALGEQARGFLCAGCLTLTAYLYVGFWLSCLLILGILALRGDFNPTL